MHDCVHYTTSLSLSFILIETQLYCLCVPSQELHFPGLSPNSSLPSSPEELPAEVTVDVVDVTR